MKYLLIIIATITFTSCSNDVAKLSKKDCESLGYEYKTKKELNFRTGEYVLRSICTKT